MNTRMYVQAMLASCWLSLALLADAQSLLVDAQSLLVDAHGIRAAGLPALDSQAPWFTWWALGLYSLAGLAVFGLLLRHQTQRLASASSRRQDTRLRLYMQTLEAALDVVLIADTKGNAVYANQAVTRIFGRRMSQVIGNPAFPLLFPSHAQELAVRDTLATEGNYKGESSHQVAGEKLVTEVAMTALDNPLADYASYIVIVRDITLRKKYEQELNESVQQLQTLVQTGAASLQRQITATNDTQTRLDHSLTESAWLVQEIHRRVRSNIQLIAGLLAMQLNKLPDPVLAAAFARSRQRIQSIAMVHEHLYESGNPVDVNFSQYAETLAANLCKEHSRLTLTVSVAMHVSAPRMRLDQAVPCGLIVAELVTNSLVHGFSGKIGRAAVEITLERQDAQLLLRVRDDGKGLPQDFKLESDNATGMELVTAMTEQLGGELHFIGATGAGFEIAFPADPEE